MYIVVSSWEEMQTSLETPLKLSLISTEFSVFHIKLKNFA